MNKNNVDFKQISAYAVPEESPGYLLWCVSMKWRRSIEKTLKQYGLTHPQFVVLATIAWLTSKPGPISQAKISQAAGLDPNTISQIIRTLEGKKFIKRAHKKDARSKHPLLTAVGVNVLNTTLPAVEKSDAQFFATLTNNSLIGLIAIFQQLLRSQ